MASYHYRRRLSKADELKAVGAAVGAAAGIAVVAWYFARILIQRTPLVPDRAREGEAGEPSRRVSGAMLRAALGPAAGD